MTFWDSSALVTLFAEEPKTEAARALYGGDAEVIVWWATPVECASALARLERDGALTRREATDAFKRLDAFTRSWIEVEPVDELREIARRWLRVHPLRAADALQLAAAFLAAERRPATLDLVTLDDRLREAAGREGFSVLDL